MKKMTIKIIGSKEKPGKYFLMINDRTHKIPISKSALIYKLNEELKAKL